MKRHKWRILISSVLVLLPVMFGLLIWDVLPDIMTIHWGVDGTADGFGSKKMAVFLPYVILLAAHWLCIAGTFLDKKNNAQSNKALAVVFWIMPVSSLVCGASIYAAAFGKEWDAIYWVPVLLGMLFLLLGNYMPKIRQNATLGIKTVWTFSSEENWNRTHRFCGRVWVVGGVLMIGSILLPKSIVIIVTVSAILPLVLVPMVYSYCVYRRQLAQGEVAAIQYRRYKKHIWITAALILAVIILMFSGKITVTYDDQSFTVDSTFWQPLTVEYDAIDEIEYLEEIPIGMRTYGFGSARLLLGTFRCEPWGTYTRYTYASCRHGVWVRSDEKILLLNGETEEETKEIYEELQRLVK